MTAVILIGDELFDVSLHRDILCLSGVYLSIRLDSLLPRLIDLRL